ncbi:MAG: DUF1361 domain-containing protein [Chlorobi bacterium]|nr:DUF1361 domain-containing protein [Chlorobiota bacterium]
MNKSKFKKIPVILTAMAILLLSMRIAYTGNIMFAFLIWNLFLAYIPYWLTKPLLKTMREKNRKISVGLLFMAWMAFLPNAPYILTDLFHLRPRPEAPIWFDLILILTFAMNGLVLWFASVIRLHNFIEIRYGIMKGKIFISSTIILSSIGIYLGRYGRWNSWDLISNTQGLFVDILHRLTHPLSFPALYGMTFTFSLFLGTAYFVLRHPLNPKS